MHNLLKVVGICLVIGIFLFGGIKNAKAAAVCTGSYDPGISYVPAIKVGVYQKNGKYVLKVTNPVYGGGSGYVWPTGSEDVYYELNNSSDLPQHFETAYVNIRVVFGSITVSKTTYPALAFDVYKKNDTFLGGFSYCLLQSLTPLTSDTEVELLPASLLIPCTWVRTLDYIVRHSMSLVAKKTADGTYQFIPIVNYKQIGKTFHSSTRQTSYPAFKQDTVGYRRSYSSSCGWSGSFLYDADTKRFLWRHEEGKDCEGYSLYGAMISYSSCALPSSLLTKEVSFTPIVEPCGASMTVDTTKYAVSTTVTENPNGDRTYNLTFTNYASSTPRMQKYTLNPNGTATTISVGCAKLTAQVVDTDVSLDLTADDCNTNKTFSHICPFPEETTIPATTVVSTYTMTSYSASTTDYSTTGITTTLTGYTTTTPYPTTSTGYTTTEFSTTSFETTTPETTIPQTTTPEQTQVNWGDMCDDFCDAYGEQYGW